MSNHEITPLDETLSSFLDGELGWQETEALLGRMRADPALQAALDRHHRCRAILRDEWYPQLDDGFAHRVLSAIDQEDRAATTKLAVLPARKRPSLTRTVMGLAMAASVAAVTVLVSQALIPAGGQEYLANRLADARSALRLDNSQHWEDLSPDAAAELNNYLISHHNSAIDHGLNGTMGMMRVASEERSTIDWAGR